MIAQLPKLAPAEVNFSPAATTEPATADAPLLVPPSTEMSASPTVESSLVYRERLIK